jgi:iron-regulated transporter 1
MEEETETRVFLSNEQHQEEEEEEEEEPSLPRSMVISLYLGYFLARWGARSDQIFIY